jgi:hypothetical protein
LNSSGIHPEIKNCFLHKKPGLKNVEPQRKEIANVLPDENRRSERRLARGLEDVSYLFFSQPSDGTAENAAGENASAEHASSEPAPPRTPVLLRAYPAFNRELLISLLAKNAAILEEKLCAIDTDVSCDPFGAIDVMAVDAYEQLCVIDIDIARNDELLLRGIAHIDWIVRNLPIVRRMYQGRVVNYSAPPRLFLVAPGFSPLFKCAARRSENPRVHCFAYRAASVSGGVGIFFENGLES